MAMRQPSKLRYVQCELPDEVESSISAFEDDFDLSLKPFYDRLKELEVDLPALEEEIDAQIALREELVRGSPVQSLGSLDEIDKNTNLTSPKRDPNDPESIRIDERKVGVAGITLINGRMFRTLAGHRAVSLPSTGVKAPATTSGIRNRLVALRHLWEVAGGDYDTFVRLGTSVYTAPQSTYTLFEFNWFKPQNMPYLNKGFTYLTSVGEYNSQYSHRMIWTDSIGASYSLKSKMATLGYDSTQINNIFSGQEPNAEYNYEEAIDTIQTLIAAITRLILLPEDDPVRQPKWENETNYIELALKRFLTYRFNKYTTSSVFDKEYWLVFLEELRPKDIKELLENRPEILDIELPQNQESLTEVVEKAVSLPTETTLINTYMNSFPVSSDMEAYITNALYDLGLALYECLISQDTVFATRAAQIKALLLELMGTSDLVPYTNPNVAIDPADVSKLFPTANLPPMGNFLDSFTKFNEYIVRLINKAMAANSATNKFKKRYFRNGGSVLGFPSTESIAMLLTRRVDWKSNFMDCSSSSNTVGRSESTYSSSQSMSTVVETTKEESVETNEQWREHRDNMSYIELRAGKPIKSISDIRKYVGDELDNAAASNTINKRDTNINKKLAKINQSSDIKVVAKKSTELLKSMPSSPMSVSSTDQTAEERSASMYAARNRNSIEQAEGKRSPSGITTGDYKKFVETALGTELPFVGGGDKLLIPFTADVSVDLQVCDSKYIKAFDSYLEGLLTLPKWLVRLVNILKHQIITFQDKIDAFILSIQTAMDTLFAKLERLLTLDLNFSGKLGFENSLFKCSWGIDFGLKVNYLDLLLLYLDRFLGTFLGVVLNFIGLLGDFINEIFCIPINWIGTILNGSMAALSELLSTIGCSVKDFKLPIEIFDLLNLIQGTFSLRSLVLKKGSADWFKMMGRFSKGKDEFQGLSQFANICQKPNLAQAVSALQASMGLAVSDIPISAKRITQNEAILAALG